MITEDKPSFKGAKLSESINRAFMYGESVFTTMRMRESTLKDWDLHFERLRQGVEFVYGPFLDGSEWVMLLKNRIEERLEHEGGDRVIRVTIYLEGARGTLSAGRIASSELKIQISSSLYDPSLFEGKMLKLRTSQAPTRPVWWPAFLKSGNYLETILAKKITMKPGDDDLLFLSNKDTVLESSVANIFIVRDNILYTAPTGPNVLDGVMRKKVISMAASYFEGCTETEISFNQLLQAKAIFGCNSVRGLFLVDRVNELELNYSQEFLDKFELLRSRVLA